MTTNTAVDLEAVSDQETENGALIAALAAHAEPLEIHRDDEVVVHLVNGEEVVTKLYKLGAAPHAWSGKLRVDDLQSMSELVTQIKGDNVGDVVTYCDRDALAITTVVDDHDALSATPLGYRNHSIDFRLRPTPQWKAWLDLDRRYVDQVEFAQFIEDHMRTITAPPAADLLELAQTFEASTSVEYRSSRRLSSGAVQLQYSEDVNASGGQSGQLEIPKDIELSLQPFVGGMLVALRARFRFRLNAGKLSLGYVLDDVDAVEDEAFVSASAEIRGLADWLCVNGSAA